MCNSKIIEVNSLNEYITVIKENKLTDYYFRGENAKNPSISSSLLRKDNSILLNKEDFRFYENIINNYYDEIATNISEFDRKNFLAFSQHHGLSTNLIDLTTSPLIALYFACSKNDNYETSNTGYVYLIDKQKTIDASRLINECFAPPANNYNLIDKFAQSDSKIVEAFMSHLNKYFWDNGFEPYKNNLINQCYDLESSPVGEIQVFFQSFSEALKVLEVTNNTEAIFNLLASKSRLNLEVVGLSYNLGIYINLLWEFFHTLASISFFDNDGVDVKFPSIPYFIYKTPYKFDRIRNQEGLFLYQFYYTFARKHENIPDSIIKQEIIPNISIIIKDQKRILEELDFIGINLKTIYGDFDNIATYINQKHF